MFDEPKKVKKENVKELLSQKVNNSSSTPSPKGGTVLELIQKMIPEVKKAIPKHLDPSRLARIFITEIRRNPKLLSCSKESLLASLMLSAQLGLEPGVLGHCYLVPYGNECQFIIGYKGMIELARRSGQISTIYAETVYENDEFEYELGLNPSIRHKPALKDRGKPIAYYGVAKFKDGGYYIKVMSKEDIEKRRKRSPAVNTAHSPWNNPDDYDQMAKKTVIREMFKYLPISPEILKIGDIPDEKIIKNVKIEDKDLIYIETEDHSINQETGEIVENAK